VVQQNGNVGVGSGTHTPTSTLQVMGNIADSISTTTSTAYTLRSTESTVLLNASATATVTLPNPATCYGRRITIKKINAASYITFFKCTGGSATVTVEGFDGSTGYASSLSAALYTFTFQSDGTKWWRL
jgi:hypothetical protein